MKTREAGYFDYGMTEQESKLWLNKCRNADAGMRTIILQAVLESNEGIAAELFFSMTRGFSYSELCRISPIPINSVDFYSYRRKALYLIKERTLENDKETQGEFIKNELMKRFCSLETVSREMEITKSGARRIAKEAGALRKIGGFLRVDMGKFYSYIDEISDKDP